MNCKLVIFILMFFSFCFYDICSAETDSVSHSKVSIFVSGDLHAGLLYDESDSNTYFPTSMRLQVGLKSDQDVELIGRINIDKNFESEVGDDDNFMVDRLFFRWGNIIDTPLSFTAGRLPTRGNNASAHLRSGLDEPESELLAFTSIIMDGVTMGYEFSQHAWVEKLTLYASSQYNYGYEGGDGNDLLDDTDIYGFNLTAHKSHSATFVVQAFAFKDVYNVPEEVLFVNPMEFALWESDPSQYDPLDPSKNLILDRTNLGNIYHTSMSYLLNRNGLNFFLTLGWSRTDARNLDELGTGLLSSWWEEPEDKDGFSVYTGIRYDLDDLGLKLGLEFNYGTKNWIAFDSKLGTRGYVAELYSIYDIPIVDFSSYLNNGFVRLGYQYYDFEYTGSGYWLGAPQDIEELANAPLAAQFYVPVDHDHVIYMAVDVYF